MVHFYNQLIIRSYPPTQVRSFLVSDVPTESPLVGCSTVREAGYKYFRSAIRLFSDPAVRPSVHLSIYPSVHLSGGRDVVDYRPICKSTYFTLSVRMDKSTCRRSCVPIFRCLIVPVSVCPSVRSGCKGKPTFRHFHHVFGGWQLVASSCVGW